jgi:hypothetical protein
MSDNAQGDSRALYWSCRFGIPILAWAAVIAFFGFSGLVSTYEPVVVATEGRAAVSQGLAREAKRPRTEREQVGVSGQHEQAVVNRNSQDRTSAGSHANQ